MTDLNTIIAEAEVLALQGDAASAERLLEKGAPLLSTEQDTDVLSRFVSALHNWGSQELEEQTLRAFLFLRRDVDALERLVYLLIQKINVSEPDTVKILDAECVLLISELIEVTADDKTSYRLANLHYLRGLRILDLCKHGETQRLNEAQADIEQYITWLIDGTAVPSHFQRANMIALAQVELSDLLLMAGQPCRAATILEGAIATLESSQVPGWMTARAYTLLDHAWSSLPA